MTDLRETLARIREQADAATDGPWEAGERCVFTSTGEAVVSDDVVVYAHGVSGEGVGLYEDAEFIAAARTDVPWLLDQVALRDKALEAVLEVHKPIPCTITNGSDVTNGTVCEHCLNPEYPCATVTAITTTLEGETND